MFARVGCTAYLRLKGIKTNPVARYRRYIFKEFANDTIALINNKLCGIKLMKGKALRKHSLHEKTAASVLLKLFISGNE